jgi:general secretion pathway protein H
MPSWARRATRRRDARRGFTLIELLVVIALLGILISIAVVSFNLIGDERGVHKEIKKLSSLIDLATDEAQMQGRDFGLEFLQTGYRFVEYDPYLDAWNEVIGDELLRPRTLQEDMELNLKLEDRRVLLQAEAKETEKEDDMNNRDLTDDYLPHVLILASGDITPFELYVLRRTDRVTVGLELKLGGELEVIVDDTEL